MMTICAKEATKALLDLVFIDPKESAIKVREDKSLEEECYVY
jgi:hypothetical protein